MTASDAADRGEQMWIELAPHNGKRPNRLLVFLHGAGSTPETFTPLALAWQYKFPGAAAIVMQGLTPGATGYGKDWYRQAGTRSDQLREIKPAVVEVSRRIGIAQKAMDLNPDRTATIGFSQGAVLALEMAREAQPCADIVVAHAGRLLRPIAVGQHVHPSIHLIHGEFDSLVLAQHSVRAFRALRDAGAKVSLDIVSNGVHSIGQDMVNVGTTRVMQTLFADRKRINVGQYGAMLTVSMDNSHDGSATGATTAKH